MEEYHTIQEITDRLKVAYLTVYRWIQAGKLKAYKAGKQYRIKDVDFNQFLEKSKLK